MTNTSPDWFNDEDLHDALRFAVPIVKAEMPHDFTGLHIFGMSKNLDKSPTGVIWAVFLFFAEEGIITHSILDIFTSEEDARDRITEIEREHGGAPVPERIIH